jgi:hypothetical protein
MAELKTRANDASVTRFLNGVADEEKRRDCRDLAAMLSEITGSEAKMWGSSIVGFGQYHYTYASGREGDWMLIGFSPRARNISLYIMSGFREYDALLQRLGKHKTGKSCLYINRLAEVDRDVLRELASRSVAWMRNKHDCA